MDWLLSNLWRYSADRIKELPSATVKGWGGGYILLVMVTQIGYVFMSKEILMTDPHVPAFTGG